MVVTGGGGGISFPFGGMAGLCLVALFLLAVVFAVKYFLDD